MRNEFYLTTPIYYVNGRPHIGHAYSTFAADLIRRFQRLLGREAYFTTGTDENAQNVLRVAATLGLTARELVDRNAGVFRATWEKLGLHADYFIRTTEARHARAVAEIFARCKENGHIYQAGYTGAYCVHDELYASEVKPGDPCPTCGRPTESVTEQNYFFRLSAFQQPLLELYEKDPDFIRPEVRRNEVVSFVRGGLKDLSISRTTIQWGIPVPDDPAHVFYVWFDALTSYMTAIGYGQEGKERQRWERLWPADLHLVGKEILRFHAVYWPAFLMAAGLPLPKQIYAHGWLLFEENKMSKSRGNVVSPLPILEVVGVDPLRYFLFREIVFGQDGSFSYDALLTRYNSDLANDLGNLSSRTLTMIGRYCNGQTPLPSENLAESDQAVVAVAEQAIAGWRRAFEDLEFTRGLEAVWGLVAAVNKYIVENQPWALAEHGDKERLGTVLYTAAESLRLLSILLYPVIPVSADKIWKQLGQESDLSLQGAAQLHWGLLPQHQNIGKVEPVFPRIEAGPAIQQMHELEEKLKAEDKIGQAAAAAAHGPAPAAAPAAPDGRISIDDFSKVEMRVGTILTAERIPKADKLLKITVDIGTEVRQVLAGIAEVYQPEELVGRKVVVVANLAPRKMRGLESNGMIVAAAVEPGGKPALVSVPADTPNGARLR